MTFEDACKLYFEHNQIAKKTIRVLMEWDEDKTVAELKKTLGMSNGQYFAYAKRYKLKYRKIYNILDQNLEKIKILCREGFTYSEILKLYGGHVNTLYRFMKKHKLAPARPSRAIVKLEKSL